MSIAPRVQAFVTRQLQAYPRSRLLDFYKSLFQDYLGAEHLVSDKQSVKAYLDEELQTTNLADLPTWYYEPCGMDSCYYRVSLRAVKEGLVSENMLLDAFIRSARPEERPSVASWGDRWREIECAVEEMNLNLPYFQEDKNYIDSVLSLGRYAISHSPQYREAYRPHYRIVERRIFEKELKPIIDMAEGRTR